jgi:uncharacterized coiled-coil protein SlyX
MNPTDVFPRRNLPGEAEEWGREVEDRVRRVEYALAGQQQGLSSANRTSASSLQELSRQLQQLQTLFDSIPKVVQSSQTATGFGLGSGWNTIVSTSITVPSGVTTGTISANGSALLVSPSTSTVVTSRSRLVVAGTAQGEIPNAWYPGSGDFRSIAVPSAARSFSVTPGSTITVSFQANPDDPASYPSNPSSYAVLSLIGTFTA